MQSPRACLLAARPKHTTPPLSLEPPLLALLQLLLDADFAFHSSATLSTMEATPPRYQAIECKTIDSTVISGWLYTVEGPAPAIIMSHGVRSQNITSGCSY